MSNSNAVCSLCEQLQQVKHNPDYYINEFETSILLVGDHQYFPGYTVLVYKEHVRELHDLTETDQEKLFKELMIATNAVVKAYQPLKMNHGCYGNAVPHIHWHLIPRYETEPDYKSGPWAYASMFGQHKTDAQLAISVRDKIKKYL